MKREDEQKRHEKRDDKFHEVMSKRNQHDRFGNAVEDILLSRPLVPNKATTLATLPKEYNAAAAYIDNAGPYTSQTPYDTPYVQAHGQRLQMPQPPKIWAAPLSNPGRAKGKGKPKAKGKKGDGKQQWNPNDKSNGATGEGRGASNPKAKKTSAKGKGKGKGKAPDKGKGKEEYLQRRKAKGEVKGTGQSKP